MLSRLILLQFSQYVHPPVLLVTTYSALIATLSYQAAASSSRPESQFSSRQELMGVLRLALDSP